MSDFNSELPVLDTYQAVVSAYSDFLTVAIHTILYERNIYPDYTFIKARKYNFPVRQHRHPKVCKWIQDAVAAVEVEILKCTVARTSLIIHAPPPSSAALERYVFSTASFPRIPHSETLTPFSAVQDRNSTGAATSTDSKDNKEVTDSNEPTRPPHPKDAKRYLPPPVSNLPEQFRATLARLIPSLSRLKTLPEDCSFTLAIELRDEEGVQAPLRPGEDGGRWIAANLDLQKERQRDGSRASDSEDRQGNFPGRQEWGRDLGGARTTPVRSLEAGAFAMEVWVEEGRGKFSATVEDQVEDEEMAE